MYWCLCCTGVSKWYEIACICHQAQGQHIQWTINSLWWLCLELELTSRQIYDVIWNPRIQQWYENFPSMTPSSVFEKLSLLSLGYPVCRPTSAEPKVPNFKTCFYRSKVIVLMKWNFFNNFQKVWTSLRQFLNFWKTSCGLPFAKPRVPCLSSPLCWAQGTLCPPLCIWPKHFKTCFYRSKVIVLMTGNVFNNFQIVWTSLRRRFWKTSCGPYLC
jgi:hypothetical protein